MNRSDLLLQLQVYVSADHAEQQFVARFIELLDHSAAFQRTHLPGHITGSAWIVDPSGEYVLLTHHAKLNRWLQPGGHADGDEDVIRVATREAIEETGIEGIVPATDNIFDLDIHTIPPRADFPAHLHYDIRYLFQASRDIPLVVTGESHALRWVHLTELPLICGNNESMMRMARKAQSL